MKKRNKKKLNPLIISNLSANAEEDREQYDFINRKKELILLDYQSLFDVYGREFTIIYSFRGWTIGLLTAYFGLLFTIKPATGNVLAFPGLFIIIAFYILEVAERSVMRRLLKEVRYLESIFMHQSQEDFNREIERYVFRDLRDEKRPLKVKIGDILISTVHLQVVIWNLFLLIAYYFLSNILVSLTENASKNIP